MAIALEQFVKQLQDSGVLAPGKLESFVPPKAHPKDVQELARQLVQQKHLTKFQAQEIYLGRAKSLLLGNYTLLDKIGAGGMGQVFKAEHRRMKRLVAIKTLPKAVTKDAAAVARFEREVEAAAKLEHSNIVTAYDADQAGDVHFLVMQYVEGSDLAAIVKKNGPLPVAQAVGYILQAACGLDYAHKHGVIHRDIKPANLLLSSEGTVKILDMGLARLSGGDMATQAELTGTGSIMGTVDFMAPEQALSTKHADARADVYSLGCTLYYLLAGQPLYDGETLMAKMLAHREGPLPELRRARPEVPPRLDAIFHKMVAKRVEDRWQTMSEVIAALEQANAGEQSASSLPPPIAESGAGVLTFLKEATTHPTHLSGPTLTATAPPVAARNRKLLFIAGAVALAGVVLFVARMLTGGGAPGIDGGPDPIKPPAPSTPTSGSPAASLIVVADPARRAAEWVIARRGILELAVGSKTIQVRKVADLPSGPFTVKEVLFPVLNGDETQLGFLADPGFRDLEVFQVRAVPITDAALVNLQGLKRLKAVRLAGARVTDMGMATLAKLPSLAELGVRDCDITDDGLAPLEGTLLVRLHLNHTAVTDAGLAHLEKLTTLTEIFLTHTKVSDQGLTHLAKLPKLKSLYIRETKVTAAGVAALKKALPGCLVQWDDPSHPTGEKPADDDDPGRAASSDPSAQPPAPKPIDLLHLIDLKRDVLQGDWTIEGGELQSPADGRGYAYLQIPSAAAKRLPIDRDRAPASRFARPAQLWTLGRRSNGLSQLRHADRFAALHEHRQGRRQENQEQRLGMGGKRVQGSPAAPIDDDRARTDAGSRLRRQNASHVSRRVAAVATQPLSAQRAQAGPTDPRQLYALPDQQA